MPHTLTLLAIALALIALWGLVALLRGLGHVLSARSRIEAIVSQHLDTLARRRLTLVKTDHYGIVDDSGWRKEYRYFITTVLLPQLDAKERAAIVFRRESLLDELVAMPVAERMRELKASLAMSQDISPAEFEEWCSSALHEAGWSSRTTGTPGDQGADVIAEKDGMTIVLQCKLHRSAIGNKAVQEAFTAQKHYGASAAAVVTNASFTRSAEALSRTTGVLLCHYSDLVRLDDLLDARASSG